MSFYRKVWALFRKLEIVGTHTLLGSAPLNQREAESLLSFRNPPFYTMTKEKNNTFDALQYMNRQFNFYINIQLTLTQPKLLLNQFTKTISK